MIGQITPLPLPPKDIHILIPGTWNIILYDKRDLQIWLS